MEKDMDLWKKITVISVVVAGCKKPYNPPVIIASNSYLVFEGTINSGTDSTFIRLTLTTNLSSKITVNPVLHAVVTVESDQNNSYRLKETKNGYYVSAGLNLDNSRKYRLNIITTATNANKQYLSDFVAVVNAPPIDSVSFAAQSNGVNLYVSTHDPKNNTRYYRWEYQETWIFHSSYHSFYKSNGDTVLRRDLVNDDVYTCWQSDTSSTITLGSSAKLVSDVIVNSPITFVASSSEKVLIEYSILVKQYALTPDAYNFWTNLKKNSEQLGGIFDAQPSQISGNIHCVTNPSEPVIGYVSAGNYTSKRIFIANPQLPRWPSVDTYYLRCRVDTLLYQRPKLVGIGFTDEVNPAFNYLRPIDHPRGNLVPIDAIGGPPGASDPVGYTGTSRDCADCTVRGTKIRPTFWK